MRWSRFSGEIGLILKQGSRFTHPLSKEVIVAKKSSKHTSKNQGKSTSSQLEKSGHSSVATTQTAKSVTPKQLHKLAKHLDRCGLHKEAANARTIQGNTTLAEPDTVTRQIFGVNAYGNVSGQVLNDNVVQNISTFYACVTLRAQTLATMPIVCYRKRRTDDGELDKDIADQHPAHWIWNQSPDDFLTSFNVREAAQGHVDLRGNAYFEIGRNFRGQAIKAWLLDPRRMQIDMPFGYDPTDLAQHQPSASIYSYTELGRSPVKLDRSEVLHAANWSWNGMEGIAPLTLFRETLGLTVAANNYTSEYFRKGGRPMGFLTKPNILTKVQRDTLREEWAELHYGSENAHQIGILSGGLDWKDIGMTNTDAQLLGLRNFQRQLVAELMRVPLGLLGDPNLHSIPSIEVLMIHFIIFTMLPLMKRWENEMNMKMFTPKEQHVYFLEHDPTWFLRGDQKTMAEVDKILIQSGVETVNSVRRRRGKSGYKDVGDKPLVMASQMASLADVESGKVNLDTGSGATGSPKKKSSSSDTPQQAYVNRVARAYNNLSETNREKVKGMLAAMNGQGFVIVPG